MKFATDPQTLRLLHEVSKLEVHTQEGAVSDPLSAMNDGGFQLLLNVGDAGTKHWALYTAETAPSRLTSIQQLVTGFERAIGLIRKQTAERDPRDVEDEMGQLKEQLSAVGTFPTPSLFVYYPEGTKRSLMLLPATIAFILCFLPFVLAAPSLIRQQEGHTLEFY